MVNEVVSYVNQTIRELHFHPSNNGAVLYRENLREVLLTANVGTGFGWDIPDPLTFQAMQAVRYDSRGKYAREATPSRALAEMDSYFYRAGSRYSFADFGGINATISLAYYEYPRPLAYRPAGSRPATFGVESGWTYAPSVNTPELQAAARLMTSNWLLMRWADVVAEGVRAKVYKRVSDTERARTSYSLYQSLRMGLVTSESADLGGF